MNKPAAKEPSMDEILSSIRQIIADDDGDGAPDAADTVEEEEAVDIDAIDFSVPEQVEAAEPEEEAEAEPMPEFEPEPQLEDDGEALELTSEQMVPADDIPEEIDLSDLAGDLDAAEDENPLEMSVEDFAEDGDDSEEFTVPELVVPDDISFGDDPEDSAGLGEGAMAAPMPDPDLSTDMANELLEPATDAAVKSAFTKLGNVALGAHNLTIENMIREMLRPMLKEWLDDNLPSVVEKMVEKEIERLSNGG